MTEVANPRFAEWATVIRVGGEGTVGVVRGAPEMVQGELWYPVMFRPPRIDRVRESSLEVYDPSLDLRRLLKLGTLGNASAFARRLTVAKLRGRLRDAVYSLDASRTEYQPYQFRPLLKLLDSDRQRLLIADEVGLGKTIEAGFIIQELKARHGIQRILVVVPASLRTKWHREMWGRFREEFEILGDSQAFMTRAMSEHGLDPHRRLQAIVSLQTIRSERVLERMRRRDFPIDLLIVDEAHHCRNSDTAQHQAVRELSADADAVLFLTATPLHTGTENLFNILRLLLPEEFDNVAVFQQRLAANERIVAAERHARQMSRGGLDAALREIEQLRFTPAGQRVAETELCRDVRQALSEANPNSIADIVRIQEDLSRLNLLSRVLSRTRRRSVYPNAARRHAQTVSVELTPEEASVYARLSEYCYRQYAHVGGDFAARFALVTLQRQFASSLHAAIEHYREVLAEAERSFDDGIEGLDDAETEQAEHNADRSAAQSLLAHPEFRVLIDDCEGALRGSADSKLSRLCEVLGRGEKVVVFAYFKRSLRYLERELGKRGFQCVRIDGDVPTNPDSPEDDERLQRIEQFQESDTQVLLSSEVGSEGLDFQFCHTLVNWDLPWNPMVVEQRIGRLDRFGQQSEVVLIFNLSSPGTIEDRVLQRLYDRVGLFEGAIGALEPILGSEIRELTEEILSPRLTDTEREELIERRAMALELRRRHEEELEQNTAALIGQDEFFNEHLERTRRLGRFVSPDEARLFLEEFLASKMPGTALRLVEGTDPVYRLVLTPELRTFVQQAITPDDRPMQRFMERLHRPELPVTFDSTYAIAHQKVEFIHALHPIIRAIASYYDAHQSEILPAAAVEVASDVVPPGDYFYLWARVEETGLHAGDHLWASCIRLSGGQHPSDDDAERLLYDMLLRGRSLRDFSPPPPELSDRIYDECYTRLLVRSAQAEETARRRNRILVESRLAALQTSYDHRCTEIRRRLESAATAGRPEIVALFQAQLANRAVTHEQRRTELIAGRNVSFSIGEPDGGGYVRVVEHGEGQA